jgi:prolyl-tRNA editing enzyme YbaK/EbsC (Cys-tRNA(Pro) deacylase)
MALAEVKEYFKGFGMEDKILLFDESSATVEMAAERLQVIPARIAKTLSFRSGNSCMLVVTAGDKKIDNAKFKEKFSMKAKMLNFDEVQDLVGHPVGGVCPFALPRNVEVYLDVSMQRFETVFPACGSANSAIELTCAELQKYSKAKEWVDVCKG